MEKYIYGGTDSELKNIIMLVAELGHTDAASDIAERVISAEQLEKLEYERSMETERLDLEEDDFVVKENLRDKLVLFLLEELIKDESI